MKPSNLVKLITQNPKMFKAKEFKEMPDEKSKELLNRMDSLRKERYEKKKKRRLVKFISPD